MLQLWHVGRISDPLYLNGEKPVSASAIKPEGTVSLVRPKKEFVTPRALETSEVKSIVHDFKTAAQNAKKAGFDGVEIHAANGYLLDQFLQDSTNTRTDEYGGSLENRAKFMLEVTDAVCQVWDSGKVGIHIVPRCDAHDMGDSKPIETFTYITGELDKRNLVFIFARAVVTGDKLESKITSNIKTKYIINHELTKEDATKYINENKCDAVAWGQDYIATPDLVYRFERTKNRLLL